MSRIADAWISFLEKWIFLYRPECRFSVEVVSIGGRLSEKANADLMLKQRQYPLSRQWNTHI